MLPTVTRSPLQCLWRDSVTLISTLLLTYWRYQTLPCTPGMNLCLLPPRCADSTQVCWLPQSLLRSATESGQNCSSDSEKLAWHAWAFNWEVLQFLKPFFFTRRYRTHTHSTHCVSKMSQVCLANITKIIQFLAHAISRDSKISCKYNFLICLAFTYFIMLWSEITRCPHHCYSVTGA